MDLKFIVDRVTINEVVKWGRAYLKAFDIPSYELDAEVLFMYASGYSKAHLFMNDHMLVISKHYNIFTKLIKKRARNIPVAYLINQREFFSLPFYVDERVLIPRPDTETLVEVVMNIMESKGAHHKASYNILEIGTGSGCISVALAKNCKNIKITAADISEGALEVAETNAEKNNVSDKITFLQSDLFEKVTGTDYDIIISNPPYISAKEMKTLEPDVKDYEPKIALDGGEDGLDFYRKIAEQAHDYLCPKTGLLFFEIGLSQGEPVKKILYHCGYDIRYIQSRRDYAGKERVVFTRNY